ncbi:MAG: HEAT repeat domain-containing protein [Elainella sp.]
MSFAVSRRPIWFRHRFRPLLVTGMACLLLLPGGALTGATAAQVSSASATPRNEAAAQSSDRSSGPGWLWLLLGIAPVGVALPWLYRWHRTNRSPDRMASPSSTPANPAPLVTSGTGRSVSQTPVSQASLIRQTTSDAQPAGSALPKPESDLLQASDRPADQPLNQPADQPTDQPLTALQPPVTSVDVAQSPASSTTRLSKIDIVEALAADLHSPDSAKRNKAIWELGQRGDSRAIQPLVDLLVDADSQQRSLILAALAEISTRTLKPMQRALMLSLQDESPDVRKNAIRDITRIYDLMAQAIQLLQYAASDSDEEVQDTARWALGQLGRVRSAELGSYPGQPSLRPIEPD